MILKELEIQGFKSFPDKIKIQFDTGITGVVGPNGSGKSNISDAIRWVLGETSSRQLRGSGKMEDVIFGGTRLRGAMGYAMVRLTLDNSDRALDVDADEVTVGRKYYRSGDSEYTINGQACRLRDVYEMLLDTGLGRDGYSAIGQGRIAEIVGARSAERREIFEEACGISKYRYRKNEAERRLAAAEDNLVRLRDILTELESRVGPLEKESARAEKFLELSARRKTLEVTLWCDNVHTARETVRENQRSCEAAEAKHARLDRDEKKALARAEDIRLRAQQLTIEIERSGNEIRRITEEMSSRESHAAVLKNDIDHNEQRAAGLEQEIAQGEELRELLAQEIAAQETEIARIEGICAALAQELAALEEEQENLRAASAESGAKRAALGDALAELTSSQTSSRVAEAAALAAAQSAAERLAAARETEKAARARREETEKACAEGKAALAALAEEEKRLGNIRAGIELKLNSRRRVLQAADDKEQEIGHEAEAAQQRLSLLRELEKNMDGYQSSVKTVMRAASSGRLRGIIGPVSSVLQVEPGCEAAIETALGAALQNVVVENEAAAKAAIALLREERAGRATFLPLDTVQPGVFRGTLHGTARLASSLVRADRRYDHIVSNLLGRIVVVEDINEAAAAARELGYRNRVVTMDGQVINAGGSFTGGSLQRSAGLFTRRQEIENLRTQLARLEKQRDAAQEATDQAKAQVDALTAELTAVESERITRGSDRIRMEMEQSRLEELMRQLEEADAQHAAMLVQLEQQEAENRAAVQQAQDETLRLNGEIERISRALSALAEGDDHSVAERARIAEAMSTRRMEQMVRLKEIELHRGSIESVQARSGDAAARRQLLENDIRVLRENIAQSRAEIAADAQAQENSRAEIAAIEERIHNATDERIRCQQEEMQTNLRARQLAEQREQLARELAQLEERRAAAESELDKGVARLWDEYQLSMTEAEALCIEFESLTELRSQVAEVRGRIRNLGSVHIGAIEEYKEVRARYDALKKQVEDVERSRAELNRMIAVLNSQMKEIFSDSFRVINENFGRIFRELFGGGEASLALEDEKDVLSSGIEIRVAPPGKVIKNLAALSGGEQALVAISIYFAIFAVNPAPFCVLDEIEAALDDANVVRYAQYLRRITEKTQFIVITHRRGTMEAADVLYGVTMQEDGVSKLLRLDMEHVDVTLVS